MENNQLSQTSQVPPVQPVFQTKSPGQLKSTFHIPKLIMFGIILLILILIVPVSIYVLKVFEAIPKANWKTYTNNIYHYSFRYPSGDTVEETVPDRFGSSVTISDSEGIINVDVNPINLPDFHKISGDSVNKRSFNGISWYIHTTQGTDCSHGCLSSLPSTVTYQTEKDGDAYTFSYDYYGNKPLLYDAIFSTFKFTDQTKTAISLTQELNNFPIYPAAIYTSKSINGSCLQQTLGPNECIKGYTVYKFGFHENEETVMNWYNGKEFPTGWSCMVFGAKNTHTYKNISEEYSPSGHFTPYVYSYLDSLCSNNNLRYKLRISSDQTIFVGIPD